MSNVFSFLRIYKDIANNENNLHETQYLYKDLTNRVPENLFKWFEKADPSYLDMTISIDAVAHEIHANGDNVLQQIYPGADYTIVKSTLDSLAGLEKSNDVRKLNRGFFTTLLSEDGFVFLEKQIARTVKEDILEAVKEYEKLFKAGIASKAEILTLSRFYPENKLYQAEIIKLGLDREDNEPMVIGGPASVEMIDKEGHLITVGALKNAFEKFMDSFRTRNANLFHSDVQCGWILPAYINRQGEVFKSGVDDKGLWVISEIRDDNTIAKKVAEGIENGELRSYSIAGSATKTTPMQKGAQTYTEVSEMSLLEITLCSKGMNQGAHFDILKSDNTTIDSFDDKALDNALMKLSDDNLYLDDFGVYADAGRNTIWITASDQIAHILKAMLAEYDNMTVSITDFIPPDAKPLYKFHMVPIWKENIVLEESKKNIDDKIQWLKKINGGNMNATDLFKSFLRKEIPNEKERRKLHRELLDQYGFPKSTEDPEKIREDTDEDIFVHNIDRRPNVVNDAGQKSKIKWPEK